MDLIRGARSVAGVLISNGILPAACSGAVKNKYRNEFVVRRVVDALSHSSRLARDVVGSRGGPRTAEGEEIEGCWCTEISPGRLMKLGWLRGRQTSRISSST